MTIFFPWLEIKADEKGKKDYEDELKKLSIKKEDIQSRLNRNREWASNFDTDIGPFQAKYARMTEKMADRYDIAKAEHLKGLQVLMDEFQYHPEYKRYSDNFTAVPFRPKWDHFKASLCIVMAHSKVALK